MHTSPATQPAALFHAAEREQSVHAKTSGSRRRYQRACQSLAGGVSTGMRRGARPYPLYFESGYGSHLVDVDSNSYLDYTLAWGPTILGHAPREIAEQIAAQALRGLTFGAQHDLEIDVAELLTANIPCADSVCFANSGTEVVQVALRLARAATGRNKYLKFEGHYHGWQDTVLVSYHPSPKEREASRGRPVPVGAGQLPPESVVVAEWNDRRQVEAAFATHGGEISAVICEPLLANSGCIPPAPGFLEFLREITRREQALLIFDEVITGFRLDLGGAQSFYHVTPDLATYGKAVGGGLPFSALAGKARYMDLIASGTVVHAGTLNGNPISLAAAKVALRTLSRDRVAVYSDLRRRGAKLRQGLERILASRGYSVATNGEGAVFHLAFMERPARNYRELLAADQRLYSDFALALLDEGVLALPDGRWYLSTAHNDDDIDYTLAAVERAAS
ncbi:MAG: aspartate aminotransferase family protein [Acidobacteria bacterium]|nr:aspartate aminotransferase family protein [Acidobacteriota bacterium]